MYYTPLCVVSWLNSHNRKEALETWKQRKGNAATYAKLIQVFEEAGFQGYADSVRKICAECGQCT